MTSEGGIINKVYIYAYIFINPFNNFNEIFWKHEFILNK